MQPSPEAGRPKGMPARRFLAVVTTLLVLASALPLSSSSADLMGAHGLKPGPRVLASATPTEPSPWGGDTRVTAPAFDFSPPAANARQVDVSPLFSDYYRRHSGATSLGTPLTAAFLTAGGWIQFFTSGALLLPTPRVKHLPDEADAPHPLAALIDAGTRDPASGLLRLSLLHALLMSGSQAPIVEGSSLTYVDLRAAATPASMVTAPVAGSTGSTRLTLSPAFFVSEGTRATRAVGHLIPLPIWSYIQRADVSPDGWQTDFGVPISEALAFAVIRDGTLHRMLVQAFWSDAVVLDQGFQGSTPQQPTISRLASGLAYLRTLGPPPVVVAPQQPVWARAETALVNTPGAGRPVAHVGEDFPLALQGDSSWQTGRLWYQVQWATPHHTFTAWADASALAFVSPGQAPGWASLDALSPDLAASLAAEGKDAGVALYDLTHRRYYTWQASEQFITGSSIKVPIMLTLLDLTERQDRELDQNELALLVTMIENSNNDSAGILYNGEVGSAQGLTDYLGRIGVSGLDAEPGAFGWSLITPLAMVDLLTRLEQGTVLTAQDRELALSLMEHIEPDQQVGVGDTAAPGATVAMKDGWVVGPDGLWTMNSSGIVWAGKETYIVAVYTQGQSSLQDGQAIARSVCGAVATLLT